MALVLRRPLHFIVIALTALTLAFQPIAASAQGNAGIGGVLGGVIGGAIGGAAGRGVGGVIAGVVIGAAIGTLIGFAIDEIERREAREVTRVTYVSGRPRTREFKNSQGQRVRVQTRVVSSRRTPEGATCRTVQVSATRDGQSVGNNSREACQVRSASGRFEWQDA